MQWRFHLQEIGSVARDFWRCFPSQKVFSFRGEMGAGKTTFISALCTEKRVTDTVGSPTFSIVNEYEYPGGSIFHIDLYR
ncbi:MAG TPA: tRNA (adenosine(37)-N6)-threonylcarbamoyltransferase complex ATPase subunit type 1 TsaE, partial [Puia sp.]|nr:tRNA (adenosine(37)-N6)-threonylcarbamoyltransferase complex ATPase subunit type 1 TsaE [Puia sp.]